MKLNLLVSCFALVACGDGSMSEEKFLEKFGQELCQLEFECAAELDKDPKFNDEGECEEFFAGITQPQGDEPDCEYDGDAANDCLSAIDDIHCDDKDVDLSECDGVYSKDCNILVGF